MGQGPDRIAGGLGGRHRRDGGGGANDGNGAAGTPRDVDSLNPQAPVDETELLGLARRAIALLP